MAIILPLPAIDSFKMTPNPSHECNRVQLSRKNARACVRHWNRKFEGEVCRGVQLGCGSWNDPIPEFTVSVTDKLSFIAFDQVFDRSFHNMSSR